MFDMMTDAIPQMLRGFVLAPYSEESAKQIASAIILFYNELKKGGISEAFAKRLTETYLGAFKIPLSSPVVSYQK
jgi:hypothetical protein